METLRFDTSVHGGQFKLLNATNGGPWHKRHANDQYRSNFKDYKRARIPFQRNHDSQMISIYGGPYSHDIPRFSRILTQTHMTRCRMTLPARTRRYLFHWTPERRPFSGSGRP